MKLYSKSIFTILSILFAGQLTISCTNKNKSLNAKVAFIDTFHRMQKTANTEESYKKVFEEAGLAKHWDLFKSNIKNEILTTPFPSIEADFTIGQSKIGGEPDLPKNIEWFKEDNGKRLSFIAQINFSELSKLDISQNLPSSGIIYFFYSAGQETAGFDIKDKDKFKVFFYDGDVKELKRQNFPNDLAQHSRYRPCKLKMQSSISLPNEEHPSIKGKLNEVEIEKYYEAVEDLDVEANKILGYADNIQGSMELECQLVTNGLYCGDATGYNDPRAKALEKGAYDWTLLFQVDSNYEEAGMMWGDMGRLYFWIKKEDLKNKIFDHCWLISQCS